MWLTVAALVLTWWGAGMGPLAWETEMEMTEEEGGEGRRVEERGEVGMGPLAWETEEEGGEGRRVEEQGEVGMGPTASQRTWRTCYRRS